MRIIISPPPTSRDRELLRNFEILLVRRSRGNQFRVLLVPAPLLSSAPSGDKIPASRSAVQQPDATLIEKRLFTCHSDGGRDERPTRNLLLNFPEVCNAGVVLAFRTCAYARRSKDHSAQGRDHLQAKTAGDESCLRRRPSVIPSSWGTCWGGCIPLASSYRRPP